MATPQEVRAALRAALGAPPGAEEIAEGRAGTEPDAREAADAARLLADASPARLGLMALEVADECRGGDKPQPNVALAALKFAHEMRLALLAEMG